MNVVTSTTSSSAPDGIRHHWDVLRAILIRNTAPDGSPLEAVDKLLLCALSLHYNVAQKAAWPSQKTLANYVGRSPRQVQRILSALAKNGMLSIERRTTADGSNTTNLYHFPWLGLPSPSCRQGIPEATTPVPTLTTPPRQGVADTTLSSEQVDEQYKTENSDEVRAVARPASIEESGEQKSPKSRQQSSSILDNDAVRLVDYFETSIQKSPGRPGFAFVSRAPEIKMGRAILKTVPYEDALIAIDAYMRAENGALVSRNPSLRAIGGVNLNRWVNVARGNLPLEVRNRFSRVKEIRDIRGESGDIERWRL